MAHVEIVESNGEKLYLMNVTDGVGPYHGMSDDVMLVKALLGIVLPYNGVPPNKLPDPTAGTLDAATKGNIKTWQQRFNQLCIDSGNPNRLTVDGRVSRARGKLSWDANRPWTIGTLNSFAGAYARMEGFNSAAHLLTLAYPHLAKILKIDPSTL